MFGSKVFDVILGVIFTLASVSLITSSITEILASLLKLRSKTLFRGIQELLNDPKSEGLVLAIYNHPMVNPLSRGDAGSQEKGQTIPITKKPSSIDASRFAVSLLDTIKSFDQIENSLKEGIEKISDLQIKTYLKSVYERAQGDTLAIQKAIEDWFNCGTERIEGIYKRKTQVISLSIGILVAVAFNINIFHVMKVLWLETSLSNSLVENISKNPGDFDSTLRLLTSLPFGWESLPAQLCFSELHTQDFFEAVVRCTGWMLTGLSTFFGAPFWFDLLGRFCNLRGMALKRVSTSTPSSAVNLTGNPQPEAEAKR